MPFVRSAVLEVAGRSHVVALVDLGRQGAYLATKAAFRAGSSATLKLVPPRQGQEVTITCEIVRGTERTDVASGRPGGVAVRFKELEVGILRMIEEFANQGFLPGLDRPPLERYEYRILERRELDAAELNLLGLDGWALAAVVPRGNVAVVILSRIL
jgi:hypothetical protein